MINQIIIFGGSRNIGQKIKNKLNKKYKVISPTSKECNLNKIKNISDFFKKISKNNYYIIYLANKFSENKNIKVNYEINLNMLKNLLEVINKKN